MKKIISKLLVLAMAFTVFASFPATASAAEAGTLPSNAIQLTSGQWYTKYWTNSNYDLNCYNKIEVPSRGYITFTATKPFDDEGEVCSYDFVLYDPNGKVVWAADTGAQLESFNEYYTYKIGLDAGTYYMNIDPSFYVYRNSAPIETQHKYTFTKASNWEIESNNNQADATEIQLGKTYYGVYRDESYDTSYMDYFKVKLTKGRQYKLTIGNYNELEAGTLIEEMYDPYGNEILPYDAKDSGNARVWTITANTTGWYYVQLDNDGNDAGTEYTIKVSAVKIPASKLKASLSATTLTYNGKVRKPSVTVKYGSKTLTKGTDYTVEYASGRKNVGKYKVKITFKGDYTGTKTLSFKIKPKATKVTSLVKGNDKFTVKWSKQKTQCSGYQIQYSTKSSFSSSKKITIKGNSTTKKVVKNLKNKKKYYVRVRTYKTVDGVKYYSKWSAKKYVTTK